MTDSPVTTIPWTVVGVGSGAASHDKLDWHQVNWQAAHRTCVGSKRVS